jgi:hypothetical protein
MADKNPIFNSIRIIPRDSDFLERITGAIGQIYFDQQANTLRLFTSKELGGFGLAREDLTNVSNASFLAKATAAGVGSSGGGASVDVSETAPAEPEEGNIWFNSNNGKIYIYVADEGGSQWVQPTTPVVVGWSSISGTPTTLAGYGITDAPSTLEDLGITDGVDGQVLTTDGDGNYSFTTLNPGGVDLTAFSVGAEAAASGDGAIGYDNTTGVFTYTPPDLSTYATAAALASAVTNSSNWDTAYSWGDHSTQGYLTSASEYTAGAGLDLTGNEFSVDSAATLSVAGVTATGTVTADDFVSTGAGSPTITSASTITLDSADGTIVTGGVFRLPSMTDTERNALTAANGDVIYNTSSNKIEAYQNGSWIELDTGAAA